MARKILNGLTVANQRLLTAQGADVASANNLTLGGGGNVFTITGTTEIQLISNTNWQDGSIITLVFVSGPNVKHAATPSGSNIMLVLAGNIDYTPAAYSTLTLQLVTSSGTQAWREIARTVRAVPNRVTFSNADYTIKPNEKVVAQIGTMAAARTLTLPAANAVPAGHSIEVYDQSGSVTATNRIVIARAGADTLVGSPSSTTGSQVLNPNGRQVLVSDGTSKWIVTETPKLVPWTFTFDGGGSVLTTGAKKVYFTAPFHGQVIEWRILADVSGSITFDVWRDTYANFPPTVADAVGGTKPSITSATKNQATQAFTNPYFAAGDTYEFNIDSATTITRAILQFWVWPA